MKSDLKNKPRKFNINNKPQFDLEAFIKEYAKREIDAEDDGYEVIPEVKKFFNNLEIADKGILLIEEDS